MNNNKDLGLNLAELRTAISEEYTVVALKPEQGFHFHTGRPLARLLGYSDEWLTGLPETSIESFAGTGNPFSLGQVLPGEQVVDRCGVWGGLGIGAVVALAYLIGLPIN